MTFEGTYDDLFFYSKNANEFAQQWPFAAKAIGGSYERFENGNKMHLDILRRKLMELYEENVRKDEDGQFRNNEDNSGFLFKSELHKEAFETGYKELMQRRCQIILA